MVTKSKLTYLKMKEPDDILSYVQLLINRLRREDLETDPVYIGKIIYLLNTWLAAYKTQMEAVELKALKRDVEDLTARVEKNDTRN